MQREKKKVFCRPQNNFKFAFSVQLLGSMFRPCPFCARAVGIRIVDLEKILWENCTGTFSTPECHTLLLLLSCGLICWALMMRLELQIEIKLFAVGCPVLPYILGTEVFGPSPPTSHWYYHGLVISKNLRKMCLSLSVTRMNQDHLHSAIQKINRKSV